MSVYTFQIRCYIARRLVCVPCSLTLSLTHCSRIFVSENRLIYLLVSSGSSCFQCDAYVHTRTTTIYEICICISTTRNLWQSGIRHSGRYSKWKWCRAEAPSYWCTRRIRHSAFGFSGAQVIIFTNFEREIRQQSNTMRATLMCTIIMIVYNSKNNNNAD